MNIICRLFGHQPPAYADRRGAKYAKVKHVHADGTGRLHAYVYGECPRCGDEYMICNIHVPDSSKHRNSVTG